MTHNLVPCPACTPELRNYNAESCPCCLDVGQCTPEQAAQWLLEHGDDDDPRPEVSYPAGIAWHTYAVQGVRQAGKSARQFNQAMERAARAAGEIPYHVVVDDMGKVHLDPAPAKRRVVHDHDHVGKGLGNLLEAVLDRFPRMARWLTRTPSRARKK